MSLREVKLEADVLAVEQANGARAMLGPMGLAVWPNFKFFRRLVGLRNGDLSRAQDERYYADGRRVK